MKLHAFLLSCATAGVLIAAAPAGAQQRIPPPPTRAQVQAGLDHAHPTSPLATVRQIAVMQEGFKMQNGRYATSLTELGVSSSPGMETTLTVSSATSYSAVAKYGNSECAFFVGEIRAPRPYVDEQRAVRCNSEAAAASGHRH